MQNQPLTKKPILLIAGLLGATAIALGAYAAHGLETRIAALGYEGEELAKRVENFQTGARYQLHAATALLAIALAGAGREGLVRIAWLLTTGALVFCGLLYALAFVDDGWRWLGAIVPLGGLAMIVAWGGIAWCGLAGGERPLEESLRSGADTDALVRLEELYTHQQHLLHELDSVVTSLNDRLDINSPKIARLDETVRSLVELQEGADDSPGEKPPHY